MKLIPILLLTILTACGQNNPGRKPDPAAVLLNNKIVPLVNHLDNPDSCRKALVYLDSATRIDSNCFLCYYNKLMFQYSLKQFDKAIATMNECIRISPKAHDLYMKGGFLYEKMGDTVSSGTYFRKSLAILNAVLDTMQPQNMNYEMLVSNKGINLIMLGDSTAGNTLLRSLADKQQEPVLKEWTLSFMNKSKKELVEMITSGNLDQ